MIKKSKVIFSTHSGIKIAVAGSYGKTTMKELLLTVLGENKKVAATPANKNVSISHARFAKSLNGYEDIVIVEYGEGKPGDVKRFIKATKPDIGVITGLAPAHLDRYKTVQAAGQDIFSLAEYLDGKPVYVNSETEAVRSFIKPAYQLYSRKGVGDWKVKDIKVSLDQTSFTMKKGVRTFKIKSGLIGRHQIGPLVCVAAIANDLGLTKKQIEAGTAKTLPYEHRLQPYSLNGACIIDDTYNGNIEGIRAGLKLLKELPAKKRIYVTPGLVDQGHENKSIHEEIGQLIAKTKPDRVVLMKNSVTDFIKSGLNKNNYKGELVIEKQPLKFYTNLGQYVAAGDVVLLQNDWTDNYN